MAIDAVKFRKAVTPGDQLVIEVVPLRKGKIFKMKGECKVNGVVVSQAEFLAGLAEKSKVS
jgi:3-hydroxyacyl-[acyl-carrier-protein] dehydratase/UDP-3-O-[3-hydroxymyristoyl] N-acetylglucosamine deacetylase/3-hydroxyacyl-[acyl-carrier-protein] dehydratase